MRDIWGGAECIKTVEIAAHKLLTVLRTAPACHSEEQQSCDVGVSQAGTQFAATKEILTSDVPSSSE